MSLMKCSTKKPGAKLLAMIRGPRFDSDQLPAAPPATDLHHRLQVQPGLVGVEQRLADADHVAGDQDLVDHLGVLAGAGAALADDRLAHRLPSRAAAPRPPSASPPIMIESRASRAPTSPPETGASTACTPCAAAACGDLDRQRRLAGGHVDDDAARPAAGQHAVGPEDHLAHVGRIADHGEDHVRRPRPRPWACRPSGRPRPAAARPWPWCG